MVTESGNLHLDSRLPPDRDIIHGKGEDDLIQEHEEISAKLHQDSLVMENRPAMAPVKFDMYIKMSWRMTEFDMTSGMMENSIEITML
jgi:hypothetical protein